MGGCPPPIPPGDGLPAPPSPRGEGLPGPPFPSGGLPQPCELCSLRLLSPLGGQLVQPAAQALREPPRVREHDRGLVLLDQVEHPLLDMRPDGPPRRGAPFVSVA